LGLRFGSQELVDEILNKQDVDTELMSRLAGLTLSLLLVGIDAPGNKDWQYAIILKNGTFTSVKVEIQPAPSNLRGPGFDNKNFDFKVVADHQILYKLVIGEIDLVQAIQAVKLEGDFGKLMMQMTGINGLLSFLAAMDIDP
jgi:hypothetical protein